MKPYRARWQASAGASSGFQEPQDDYDCRPRPKAHGLVTAALLVIGDEILSGRTKDKNIGYIAEYLTALGIDLTEVRVVGDDETAIVTALNALARALHLCVHHRRHRPDP